MGDSKRWAFLLAAEENLVSSSTHVKVESWSTVTFTPRFAVTRANLLLLHTRGGVKNKNKNGEMIHTSLSLSLVSISSPQVNKEKVD